MRRFLTLITLIGLISTALYARPPRPGPGFIWVPAHVNKNGVVIKGHWKHPVRVKKHRVSVHPRIIIYRR